MCKEEADDLERNEKGPDSPPDVGECLGGAASFGAEFGLFRHFVLTGTGSTHRFV
jgi:hypothetical protein